jgi:MFS family permease
MNDAAAGLVRRYYLYSGIYTLAASIIWGINTLFLLDAGLSIGEVFLANSAFSVGVMVFELPTGVVADLIGRRPSLLLSVAVLGTTTLAYVGLAQVGGGVLSFAAVSVLMGLGFTFYSGAMEAWLVDGLRHHNYDGELDRVFSRAQMIGGAAMLVGTVGGGVLGQVDLAVPFVVRAALLFALFGLAWFGMRDLGFEPRHVPLRRMHREALRMGADGVRLGFGNPSLRLLLLATAVQSGFFSWAWYAWQPYFLELLGNDAVWVAGVVAALLAVSIMVGNAIVEFVMRWCGRRTTLFIGAGVVFSIAMVGVGVVSSFVPAVALLSLAGVAMGTQAPVRQAFIHHIVPSEQRATVISFDSMVSGGGGVIGQSGLGAYSDQRGFSAGYIVGGAVTVLALPLLAVLRSRKDDADYFTSSNPDHACPTPAIPAISHIEGRTAAEV